MTSKNSIGRTLCISRASDDRIVALKYMVYVVQAEMRTCLLPLLAPIDPCENGPSKTMP